MATRCIAVVLNKFWAGGIQRRPDYRLSCLLRFRSFAGPVPGRGWAKGDAMGGISANVIRPLVLSSRTSSLSSRPRIRACPGLDPGSGVPTSGIQCHTTTGLLVRPAMTKACERSGRWGAQRSGIKGESAGRRTAAELSAAAARSTRDAPSSLACHHFGNDSSGRAQSSIHTTCFPSRCHSS